MNTKSQANMYKLIRELGDVLGIARMTVLCLDSFIESIRLLKCRRDQFDALYKDLAKTITECQPSIIPLMRLLKYFEEDMEREIKPEMDMATVKQVTIRLLKDRVAQIKRNTGQVTENGLAYVKNRDVIIVHSASTVVINTLIQAKEKLNRNFKVIILDLSERTRQSVQALSDAGIDYIVTPAHNLSHHIEGATKMFLGAMTITKDGKIVAPVGTAGTVSLCRHHNVKVHLFANTLNYSIRSAAEQKIFQAKKEAQIGATDFAMTTHSHDLVSLSHIDHIITEIGEVAADGDLSAPPVPIRGKSADGQEAAAFNVGFQEMAPASS